jgi:arylsulfatase A-like enzyme
MLQSRAALLLTALLLAGCGAGQERERHNVLVVLVDTLRADRLPFYGYTGDTAPFLTSWARRSVVFDRAWAASSWTAPATASVFTGVYPNQHGVVVGMEAVKRMQKVSSEFELSPLPDELETLPEFLSSAGYHTFGVTDNPNIGKELGFDHGFERFVCFQATRSNGMKPDSEQVTATVREWSAEIRAAEPWFLYLHFMDPHSPYEKKAPFYRAPGSAGDGTSAPPFPPERVARGFTPERLAEESAAYDSEIRFLDQEIEKVFAALGVGEDTVVVFLADHGEEFGDHGGIGHDPQLYSELTHIPLFVHVPGIPPRRERENVSQVDLLPTLRDLMQSPRNEQSAGTSLRALLEAGQPLAERTLFSMRHGRAAVLRGAISGDHKYIVTDFDARFGKPPLCELYDLAQDPQEKTNLVEGEGALGAELDARLRAQEANAPKWSAGAQAYNLAPELLRKLQELGYAGEDEDDKHVLPRELQSLEKHKPKETQGGG